MFVWKENDEGNLFVDGHSKKLFRWGHRSVNLIYVFEWVGHNSKIFVVKRIRLLFKMLLWNLQAENKVLVYNNFICFQNWDSLYRLASFCFVVKDCLLSFYIYFLINTSFLQ